MSLISLKVSAQYDVAFSHYYAMPTSFNPAAAGKDTKLNLNLAYAMDMVGFEHNPQTAYVSADMPFHALGMRHGVGLRFMNDKLGLFTHQNIAAQYVYRKSLADGFLGIGLQAGLLSETFDGSKADVEDSGDDAIPTSKVDGNGLDLGAGIYYNKGAWYAGASVQHLNSPLIALGERNELKIDPTVYLSGKFHGIVLSYSYEIYTNGISMGNGSHEISIAYQTDINFFPKGKNRHQSVRYL